VFAEEPLLQRHAATPGNTLQHVEATVFVEAVVAPDCRKMCMEKQIAGDMCVETVRCVLPCALLCVLQCVLLYVLPCVVQGETCLKKVIQVLCSEEILCRQQEE